MSKYRIAVSDQGQFTAEVTTDGGVVVARGFLTRHDALDWVADQLVVGSEPEAAIFLHHPTSDDGAHREDG